MNLAPLSRGSMVAVKLENKYRILHFTIEKILSNVIQQYLFIRIFIINLV